MYLLQTEKPAPTLIVSDGNVFLFFFFCRFIPNIILRCSKCVYGIVLCELHSQKTNLLIKKKKKTFPGRRIINRCVFLFFLLYANIHMEIHGSPHYDTHTHNHFPSCITTYRVRYPWGCTVGNQFINISFLFFLFSN